MLYNLWRNGDNLGAVNPHDVNLIELKMLHPQDDFAILEDGETPYSIMQNGKIVILEQAEQLELPFAVGDDFTDSLKASLAEHTLTTQDLLLEELQKAREENLKLQTEVLDLRAQLFNKEL